MTGTMEPGCRAAIADKPGSTFADPAVAAGALV
jgi:hypothetical protein